MVLGSGDSRGTCSVRHAGTDNSMKHTNAWRGRPLCLSQCISPNLPPLISCGSHQSDDSSSASISPSTVQKSLHTPAGWEKSLPDSWFHLSTFLKMTSPSLKLVEPLARCQTLACQSWTSSSPPIPTGLHNCLSRLGNPPKHLHMPYPSLYAFILVSPHALGTLQDQPHFKVEWKLDFPTRNTKPSHILLWSLSIWIPLQSFGPPILVLISLVLMNFCTWTPLTINFHYKTGRWV